MGDVGNFLKNPVGKIGDALGLNPAGPNMGAFGATPEEQEFVKRLIARSKGEGGPSVAEAQLQQGLDTANANAMGLAAANRGVSPALAARMATQAQGQNAMSVNQAAATLRAQEQLGGDQLLANMMNADRNARMQGSALEYKAGNDAANRNAGMISSIGSALIGGAGMAKGGKITGGVEVVPGDSPANDVVPTMLSKGEIVIPKSKADDPAKAKEFIDQLMKNKKPKREEKFDFGKLLKTQREILERIKALEGSEDEEEAA